MYCLPVPLFAVFLFLLVPGAGLAQSPAAAANPSFNLLNRGAASISAFFATPAGRDKWGRDRLDGSGVVAGGKVAVHLPADGNCIYDLRTVFADGHDEVRREVNVCKVDDISVGVAAAAARQLLLRNHAVAPITAVAARPQGGEKWLTNHLPGGPITPGSERSLSLPPGGQCVFDLIVTFADGKTREKNAADLCKSPDQAVQ